MCLSEAPCCSTCGRSPHRVEIYGRHELPICRNCQGPHSATDNSCPLRKQLANQHGYQHKLRISRHRQMPQIACNNAPKAPANDNNEKIVSTSQPGDHSSQSLPPVSRPTNDSAEVAKTPSSPKPSSGSSLDFNGR